LTESWIYLVPPRALTVARRMPDDRLDPEEALRQAKQDLTRAVETEQHVSRLARLWGQEQDDVRLAYRIFRTAGGKEE
jgi:hypothetical protein